MPTAPSAKRWAHSLRENDRWPTLTPCSAFLSSHRPERPTFTRRPAASAATITTGTSSASGACRAPTPARCSNKAEAEALRDRLNAERFEAWRKTGRDVDDLRDHADTTQYYTDDYPNPVPGRLYDPGHMERRPDGQWWFCGGNWDFSGTLDDAERVLFDDYASDYFQEVPVGTRPHRVFFIDKDDPENCGYFCETDNLGGGLLTALQQHDFFREDAHADDGGTPETDPWPRQIHADLLEHGHTDLDDRNYVWFLIKGE